MALKIPTSTALDESQAETIAVLRKRIERLRDQLDDAEDKNEQLSNELEQLIGDAEPAASQLNELRHEIYGWIVLNNAPHKFVRAFGLSEYHAALHDVMDAIDTRIKALDAA